MSLPGRKNLSVLNGTLAFFKVYRSVVSADTEVSGVLAAWWCVRRRGGCGSCAGEEEALGVAHLQDNYVGL